MIVREYCAADKREWLRCRVVSFLDCSYYNDVVTKKEPYENDAVCLVAVEDGRIVGLIDAEIEIKPHSLCVAGDRTGAVIWHLAVLPEYRRKGVAAALMERALAELRQRGVARCEVWTQEDEPANRFYRSQGFRNLQEHNWLRCYARPSKTDWFLNRENVGEIYGVEEMIFETTLSRKSEVAEYCYRMDEVRLYAKEL
ncbi:MAG: GNAT family N-acetyltransferase [Ruminococcaceae bacterium]|nr:GNAT family N-acetyltransferase [Oscillospiraceae bacterium]